MINDQSEWAKMDALQKNPLTYWQIFYKIASISNVYVATLQDYNQRGVSWIYGYCSTIEPLQNETVFSFFDSMQYTKVSAVDILCYIGALLRKFPHNLEQMATLNYREHKYNRLLDPPFLLFKRQKNQSLMLNTKFNFDSTICGIIAWYKDRCGILLCPFFLLEGLTSVMESIDDGFPYQWLALICQNGAQNTLTQ